MGRRRAGTRLARIVLRWCAQTEESDVGNSGVIRFINLSEKDTPMICLRHIRRAVNTALAPIGLLGAALLAGCAGQPETVTLQQPGGPPQQVTMPKATWTGAASGAQADALAQAVVDANNNTMKQFDAENGRLDKIQSAENKDYQTAQQTLVKLEQLSNEQGSGQITLFFKTGSVELDTLQTKRVINVRDHLARESRGRTVILVCIGSASATGNPQINKKLSIERSDAPLPLINQYLVNVPHKFYKVTGIGDMYAPKNASLQVDERYQSARIIAAYSTSDLPATPSR